MSQGYPQHYSQPPGYPPQGYAQPPGYPTGMVAPKRNVALLVVGIVLLLIALGAGVIFIINLNQYLTVADRWANDPLLSKAGRNFGVAIIKAAAKRRMFTFGPVSGLFGVGGLVCLVLGIRKK